MPVGEEASPLAMVNWSGLGNLADDNSIAINSMHTDIKGMERMDVNERRMNKRRFPLELIQNDPRESRRRVKCPRGLVSVFLA